MQFTDKYINALKADAGQTKPRDIREKSGQGFGITLFPSGEKSFILENAVAIVARVQDVLKIQAFGSFFRESSSHHYGE